MKTTVVGRLRARYFIGVSSCELTRNQSPIGIKPRGNAAMALALAAPQKIAGAHQNQWGQTRLMKMDVNVTTLVDFNCGTVEQMPR